MSAEDLHNYNDSNLIKRVHFRVCDSCELQQVIDLKQKLEKLRIYIFFKIFERMT
jgi:hypothetical protein